MITCLFPLLRMTLIVVVFSVTITQAMGQTVEISDPGLEAAIREALDIPTGEITHRDMLRLTELDASRETRASNGDSLLPIIKSLEGLETAVNLTYLNLEGLTWARGVARTIQLNDFSPLDGLSHLMKLNLSNNHLSHFELPGGLVNLSELFLEGNPLEEYVFLDDLSNDTVIHLWGNSFSRNELNTLKSIDLGGRDGVGLTTLTLPAGLSSLTSIDLSDNKQLKDYSFLENLSSLTSLNLSDNQLTSFTLPEKFTRLTSLNLNCNPLTSLNLPDDLSSLISLNLSGHLLTSLTLPEGLVSLERLNLRTDQLNGTGVGLSSLTLPKGMNKLAVILLNNNPITSLSVPNTINLDELAVSGFAKEDITIYDPTGIVEIPDPGLEAVIRSILNKPTGYITATDMEQLTDLHASDADIRDIQGIQYAVHLTHLDLSSNYLNNQVNLSLLSGLNELEYLDLSHNQLTKFHLLSGLTKLHELDLSHNQLINFDMIDGLATLQHLDLMGNQLQTLELGKNFPQLINLRVSQNLLQRLEIPRGLITLAIHDNPIEVLDVEQNEDLKRVFLSPVTKLQLKPSSSVEVISLGLQIGSIEYMESGRIRVFIQKEGMSSSQHVAAATRVGYWYGDIVLESSDDLIHWRTVEQIKKVDHWTFECQRTTAVSFFRVRGTAFYGTFGP